MEKLQSLIKSLVPHLMVLVVVMVVVGISGSLGLKPTYQILLAYALGAIGHVKLVKVAEKKYNGNTGYME